jgi:uncharacterized membrane protein
MEMNAPTGPKEEGNKILALLAYLLGWLGIIFVFIDQGKNDPWLRMHAWQAFFLGLVAIVASMITFGIGWFVVFIFQIVYALKAYKGEYFEVPVIGGLAKAQALK